MPVVRVANKVDLSAEAAGPATVGGRSVLRVSAKTGVGIDALRAWLLEVAGWKPHGEGLFMARSRHLVALATACDYLASAENNAQGLEFMAEDLRLAQQSLGHVTGEVSADDLLGEIFSRFCIGK